MNTTELQAQIRALADLPFSTPEADWMGKVRAAPVDVLAGAMLTWKAGGITGGPDPYESRRAAVQAILQERLFGQVTATMRRLNRTGTWLTIVGLAIAAIGAFGSVVQALRLWGGVGH